MELRYLETFQTIVRIGSFFRAAEELDCAQSTVTLHVQKLEAALGVRLFERDGKRPTLTEAGEMLRDHAVRVLDQATALEQAMADIGSGEQGHLRIGAVEPTAALRLAAVIVSFCQRRPALRLTLEAGGTHALSERVAAGELDLAICSTPHGSAGLSFEPLFEETMVLLAPEDHPLARKEPLLAADLGMSEMRLLSTEPGCAYRENVERMLLQHGATVAPSLEIGSGGVLKAAVQQGLGVAIVPLASFDPTLPGVVTRHFTDLSMAIPVGIARRPNGPPPSAALQAFVAMLRSHLHHPAPIPPRPPPSRLRA